MAKTYAKTVTTLDNCQRIVWQARRVLKTHWPTPNQLNSLRFAVTEGGEAVQAMTVAALAMAWENSFAQQGLSLNQAYVNACAALDGALRSRVHFARNRDKVVDIADELTDCAMMLLTALGPTWQFGTWIAEDRGQMESSVETICAMVAGAAKSCCHQPEAEIWQIGAERALAEIVAYKGFDLTKTLTARLERISMKHTGASLKTLLSASVPPVGDAVAAGVAS